MKYCQAEQGKLRKQSQAKENKLSVYSLHIIHPLLPPSNASLFQKKDNTDLLNSLILLNASISFTNYLVCPCRNAQQLKEPKTSNKIDLLDTTDFLDHKVLYHIST